MKNKKRIILIIAIALGAALIGALIIATSEKEQPEKTTVEASDITLDQENIDDLKNGIGKGTAGDVVKVEEGTDEEGNRQYTYTFKSGKTRQVVIRPAGEGEGSGVQTTTGEEQPAQQQQGQQVEPKVETPGTVYERFCAMTPYEQYAFYETFKDQEEYMEWVLAAQEEYLSLHPAIEVGPGEVIEFK